MGVEVLKKTLEINRARQELRRRGLSCIGSGWLRFLRQKSLIKGVSLGDPIKSWDIIKTANFIETHISKEASILDIGAYASEILCILHRLGYPNLTGIDLNPDIRLMPYAKSIRYETGDFIHTRFDDHFFEAITAISVIEHGFNSKALLLEVSRLLRRGGYFIASFDYWPEKVDTHDISLFGMDWRIFSRDEVASFLKEAYDYGLAPCGTVNLDVDRQIIHFANRHYTFAWLVLQKG